MCSTAMGASMDADPGVVGRGWRAGVPAGMLAGNA